MTESALLNLGAWSAQAGALALAAAAIARVIPLDAPAARYGWWRAVLVVCLALPVIQPWRTPPPLRTDPVVQHAPAAMALEVPAPAPFTPSGGVASWTSSRRAAVIPMVLIAGALARLAWLAAGLIRLRRTRRAGVPADPAAGPDLLQALIDAGAEVRQVSALRQPLTFGVVRPVVLLPQRFGTLPLRVQRAVLAHEWWHVRRRDWLWTLAEETLRAILWFHPAIWYLVSRVQGAREEVVDELSILSTNSRRSYLEALLAFADEPAVHPATPFARRRQLFARMMLISREVVMSPKRILASMAAMAGVLVMTGWYGSLVFPFTAGAVAPAEVRGPQPQAQPRDPRPASPGPATPREQQLRAATAADPSHVSNWLELARLQEQRGATADAAGTFEAAMAGTSGHRRILMAQAEFLRRTRGFAEAVAVLEDAADRNPGDPWLHQRVATYHWERAQKDASLTAAEKLTHIDSGIRATDRALVQDAAYVDALTYKNILLRMKAGMETDEARRGQLLAEASGLRSRAIALAGERTRRSYDGSRPAPPPPPPHPADHYQIDGRKAVPVGGPVKPPAKIHHVAPVYPEEARAAGVADPVIIELAIDTQGAVRSTFVKRTSPLLAQAALDAVRQWRFAPTVLEGVPVPVLMTVSVGFQQQ